MKYKLLKPEDPMLKYELPAITFEQLKNEHGLTPQELYENLKETMLSIGGIGLSANQCGLPVRAFIMLTDFEKKNATIVFNPEVTWVSEETEMFVEGCLTYPHLFLNLKRPRAIRFTYMDINGETHSAGFSGLTARIFQHEYDHMQGRNFTEWASKLKLEMAMKKATKKIKKVLETT
jgi:peptide deformylase